MSEETLTTSHLTGAETTTEVTQITSEYSMMSLSSLIVYFHGVVLVIGIVGTAANALILYGLVASKEHKKQVLIFNQNALDLFTGIFLMIGYAVRLCNIPLTGLLGYWLCMTLYCDVFVWTGMAGSTINLASITVERYLKVVHAVWSKKKLRNWMIYSAAAFAWIFSAIYNFALVSMTVIVIDGTCFAYYIWQDMARLIHNIWYSMSFYVIILLIFIFGYWRILVVIRRQARVMAGHSAPGSSTVQTQSSHIETTVIKTMILVSALFAITQLPIHILTFIPTLDPNIPLYEVTYYGPLFLAYVYIFINPFIYAIKFDPVKQALLRLIPCKKISNQPNNTNTSLHRCST